MKVCNVLVNTQKKQDQTALKRELGKKNRFFYFKSQFYLLALGLYQHFDHIKPMYRCSCTFITAQ